MADRVSPEGVLHRFVLHHGTDPVTVTSEVSGTDLLTGRRIARRRTPDPVPDRGARPVMNRVLIPCQPTGPLPYAWRECVGTGRLNLALRADYQESAALVQREIGFRYIRGHGLLSDDMGVLRRVARA